MLKSMDIHFKAVASDQHNYDNNIKMIKAVHQLTLRPNMLISLIDQFTIFGGWIDSGADTGADPGFFVRGDPHMGQILTHARTHAYIHTYIHTYIRMYRQAH